MAEDEYDNWAKRSHGLVVADIKKAVADTVDIKDVLNMGKSCKKDLVRCLFYTIYLSAGRVREVNKLTTRDIRISDEEILFDLITEKNKTHPLRTVPAIRTLYKDKNHAHFRFNENEVEMINEILKYINDKKSDEKLFPYSRQRIYNLFVKYFHTNVRFRYKNTISEVKPKKINPHYLRHCRITHWTSEYNLPSIMIEKMAGWTNLKPFGRYSHLQHKDITEAMKR